MDLKEWILLIVPILFSVASIFISNSLGVKTTTLQHKIENEEKAYLEFYIPLIQWISKTSPEFRDYAYMIAVPTVNKLTPEFFYSHFFKNIKFAPKSVVTLYSEYFLVMGNLEMYVTNNFSDKEAVKQNMKASILFDKIILESLSQARELSSKLGYPNIAEPIYESFSSLLNSDEKYSRHLPLQGRKHY